MDTTADERMALHELSKHPLFPKLLDWFRFQRDRMDRVTPIFSSRDPQRGIEEGILEQVLVTKGRIDQLSRLISFFESTLPSEVKRINQKKEAIDG